MQEELIRNQQDINKYKEYNKIYIPNEYNNTNYRYFENGNYIRIVTNNNCYTQYNNTYCDIYDYNVERNLISKTYTGNSNPNLVEIDRQYVTSNINYSPHIREIYIQNKMTIGIVLLIGIVFAIFLSKELRLK